METLIRDLRFGLRMVAKRPGVTLTAALCLALGIGAVTVVYSLVSGILLDPLPYEEPHRLVLIWTEFSGQGVTENKSSNQEVIDYREQNQVFTEVEAMLLWYFNLTSGEEPERLIGGMASAGLFPLLGFEAEVGRTFLPEEGDRREKVVILSHRLWQQRFGGDPEVVGKTLSLEDVPYTVVGVMPEDFYFILPSAELWVPWSPDPRFPRYVRLGVVAARLKPGVSLERAQADVDLIAARLREDHADAYPADSGFGLRVVPIHEYTVGHVRPQLLILLGAVALVLLIAYVNVANLLLVQASRREPEIGLRSALGARRFDLVRQLLSESLVLAILGGGLGVLAAFWGVRSIQTLDPYNVPRLDEVGVDWGVLGFALAVSIATGVLFGLVPALRASKIDLYESLREGAKASASASRHLLRLLVISEVALALVVLVGTGLMVRTFHHYTQIEPGFRTRDVVVMQIFLSPNRYNNVDKMRSFYRQLTAGLEARPEIETVGLVNHLPLYPLDEKGTVTVIGREEAAGQPNPAVSWRTINPGYFEAMGIARLKGRTFTELDDEEAEPVAILDVDLARRLWPGEDPIGQRLKLERDPMGDGGRTVVGVVGAIRDDDLVGGDNELLYLPYIQFPYTVVALALHTPIGPESAAATVREVIAKFDPFQPVGQVLTTETLVDRAMARARLNRTLFNFFGLAALVLVAVGIYGIMSYSVSLRTREIGLRMALGARRGEVLKMVIGQGMKLVGLGLALGLIAVFGLSLPLARYLSGLLLGVGVTDVPTLAAVSVLVAALALLACLLPALRASRVEPMTALREE